MYYLAECQYLPCDGAFNRNVTADKNIEGLILYCYIGILVHCCTVTVVTTDASLRELSAA